MLILHTFFLITIKIKQSILISNSTSFKTTFSINKRWINVELLLAIFASLECRFAAQQIALLLRPIYESNLESLIIDLQSSIAQLPISPITSSRTACGARCTPPSTWMDYTRVIKQMTGLISQRSLPLKWYSSVQIKTITAFIFYDIHDISESFKPFTEANRAIFWLMWLRCSRICIFLQCCGLLWWLVCCTYYDIW